MNKEQVITRLAPSPTGLFHIGTARTALFNYLFAKKNNGKFILRIEDTDAKRSKKEYERDIIDGMKWLNLKWNGSIYYQSNRKKIYKKYVEKLLKEEKAYKSEGAIWFRLSAYSKDIIEYDDLVLGKLKFNKLNFNDFVLIKSDGVPLYMFAAVVDDYEMGMTHIIRGDDHVNSTPQQIMLYDALGVKAPRFAHIPMILNSDRTKMSKRKNPVSITRDFRDQGYLPEAMINYMALLGWNPKTDQEKFDLNQLIKAFDISKVNKSGAIFDIEKLNYFNKIHMRDLSDEILVNKLCAKNNEYSKFDKKFLSKIMKVELNRMPTLLNFPSTNSFYFKFDGEYDKQLIIFKKSNLKKSLLGITSVYNTLLKSKKDIWSSKDILNEILLEIVKANELGNGDVFWPVRVALSGLDRSASPPELLWVFGKEESIERIKIAIDKLSK